jgi:two-component system OmpR family response regulator
MATKAGRILLVDDDPGIRSLVKAFLEREGFEVEGAGDSIAMREKLAEGARAGQPFDLLVLDLMLPGEGGLDVLCRLQEQPDAPAVIILSAMVDVTDRITGLDLGADDYLAKPCNPRELLARIRAVLRRRGTASGRSAGMLVGFAGWKLDRVRRELRSPGGVVVGLSEGEFLLLNHFVEHPGEVLSRETLLALSGSSESGDRSIDVQISRLRRKLAHEPGDATSLIRTVRNGGYMMKAEVRAL